MKVLHIFDIAGVAYILSKYLKKVGHTSHVINMHDPFGFNDFYGGEKHATEQEFMAAVEKAAPEYDILHLHLVYEILPRLAKFGKPVVMHYHGSELVLSKDDPYRQWAQDYCKAMLVSNQYMLEYEPKAQWLPNPVDTEHFKPTEREKQANFAFDIQSYLDNEAIKSIAGDIPFLWRLRNIPYSDMPDFLNKWKGYVDVKVHKDHGLLPALSKTGLEALACGLQVLNWKKEWQTGLPKEHEPENVVNQLVKLYESII